MDQHDNPMLSEFDHLLDLPPLTVGASSLDSTPRPDLTTPSFPLDLWGVPLDNTQSTSNFSAALDPMSTLPGLGIDYPTPGPRPWLSQNNLAVFDSLFQSQEDALPRANPPTAESSTAASRPRFVPPKGPRKQHRTGFRQLPGANGIIKRGRPSKKEYILAGVEVDMYAVKGVTLNGPAKSLAEVKGGELISKRGRRSSRRASNKSKSSMSEASRAETAPRPAIATIQEEPLFEQAPAIPSQSFLGSQDMLFSSTQGTSAYSYPSGELNTGVQDVTQQDVLSAFQAVNDEISSLLYRDSYAPSQQDFGSSEWAPNSMADPAFQPVLADPGFQPVSSYDDPLVDPNAGLPYPSLPWDNNGSQVYANPPVGLDGFAPYPDSQNVAAGPSYDSTFYNESADPSVYQDFPY